MADKYQNFEQLSAENTEGKEFRIVVSSGASTKCIIAPHGGAIEKGTSEIARGVAGKKFGLYLFEGCKPKNNGDLHITSTRFDEPLFNKFIDEYEVALGVHGRKDRTEVENEKVLDRETIFIGGLNKTLIASLDVNLRKAGFKTRLDGHKFLAKYASNVCNRPTNAGAQIELPRTLRLGLEEDKAQFESLVSALQLALDEI